MRKLKLCILVLLLIFPAICYADSTCTFKEKAEYSKLAQNVRTSYDIVDDGINKYIVIKVYNVVDGIRVHYTGSSTNKKVYSSLINEYIAPYDTTDGVYEFKHYNINSVFKYKFSILSTNGACGTLKTITLTVPAYNKYAELDECQYYDVHDYLYCQRWVSTNITYNEPTVLEKIKRQRESLHKTTTTYVSIYDQDNTQSKYEWLVRLRILVIIGLSIGIVVDIVVIVFLSIKLKEDLKFSIEF
jgi:hypothetical protein